ncbi:hypothetical protein [Nonomuraea sp. NPDC003804]|uniref:hypothetical protein n=1 Tax=Nonomuraea sp. NPDC003804 TaxID=3154547 RepID=UPI0033BBD1E2
MMNGECRVASLVKRVRAVPARRLDLALTALVLAAQLWPLLSGPESWSWWGTPSCSRQPYP